VRLLLAALLAPCLSEGSALAIFRRAPAPDPPRSLGLDQALSRLLLQPVCANAVGEPAKSFKDVLKASLRLAIASGSEQLLALLEHPADLDALVVDSSLNSVLEGLGHARDLALAVAEDELGPELGCQDLSIVGVSLVSLAEALARLPIAQLGELNLTHLEVVPRQGRALLIPQREFVREPTETIVFW
tara:strand:+ start:1823 stop:2386 length:564 start_codon:yes stop_codon:yes gene_type:complete